MTAERPKALSIRKRGSSQLLRNVLSRWPILVWLGVALFALQLYRKGVQFQRINGIVYADTQAVAPLEDGILLSLKVGVGDMVTEGQVVAEMDPSLILTEIEDFESTFALERLERMQRFLSAYTDAEDELAKIQAEEQADTEQATFLEQRVEAMKEANTERPGTHLQTDIDKVELEYRAVKARVDSYAERVKNLTNSRDSAKAQMEALAELEKGADAESSAGLKFLHERLKANTLKASRDGIVATINQKPGSVVPGGDPLFPVLTIVSGEGLRVRAFLLEDDAAKVKVGAAVTIRPTSAPENIHKGEVLALAPQIISKLDAASTVNNRMVTGREIEVRLLDDGAGLIPGQAVVLEVGDSMAFDWWSFGFRRDTKAE